MTANNVITDGDEPYISYTFSQPFRAERLRQQLESAERPTTEWLAALQSDMVSWAAQAWCRLLGGLGPLTENSSERARLMLAGWDGELRGDSGPALLYGGQEDGPISSNKTNNSGAPISEKRGNPSPHFLENDCSDGQATTRCSTAYRTMR